MSPKSTRRCLSFLALLMVAAVLFGCAAPAAPSPTAAAAKPAAAPTSAPAAAPTAAPAAQPTAAAKPAAAAPTAAAAAPAKPATYRLAHIVPLTGSNAELGNSFNNAAKLAVDDVNAKGGIDGTKIELVAEDSMADPKQGVTAFNKIARVDKIPAALLSWSSVVAAIAPILDENKVVGFNYAANAINLRGAAKYLFNTYPLADLDIARMATYAYDDLKARKAAIFYINADMGISASKTFKSTFEAKGGTVVANETYAPESVDFGAQLAKIKAANPDVLFISCNNAEPPRVVKQARELGIKVQILGASYVETQAMLDQGGDAADGLLYLVPVMPETNPDVQSFLNLYKSKYGQLPSGSAYAMTIWDTVETIFPAIVKQAQQKGYGFTGEGLRQALIDIKTFDTKVSGKTDFQFPGNDSKKPITLKRINMKEKKFETLSVLQTQ